MKRFSFLLVFLVLIVSCLFSFVSAADAVNGVSGEYVGKILNWQYYVQDTTEVPLETVITYDNFIDLPYAFVVEQHDNGGAYGSFRYTADDTNSFILSARGNTLTYYSAYLLSLEDIFDDFRYGTYLEHTFIAADVNISAVSFETLYYDELKNLCGSVSTGSAWDINAPTFSRLSVPFAVATASEKLPPGAKYARFAITVEFSSVYAGREINVGFDMPELHYYTEVPFSFGAFPVDGFDSDINSLFVPDGFVDYNEQNIFNQWKNYLPSLVSYFEFVRTELRYLNAGFVFWSNLFGQFLGISFVRLFIYTAFCVGLIGFIVPLAAGVINSISKRKERKDE